MIDAQYQGIAFVLFAAISLFVILREFFCWYYKINKRVELMEEQRDLLKELLKKKKSD